MFTVRSSTRNTTYGGSSGGRGGRAGGSGSSGGYGYGGNSGGGYQRMSTAYDWAVYSGQSSYNWSGSRIKEAGNIQNSWTKILEKAVKKFCTTLEKLEKQMTKDSRARNLKQEMLRKSKELNKDKAWYKFLDKYGLAISNAVLGGMAVVIAGPVSAPVLAGGILTGGSIGGLIQELNNKGHQVGLALGTALIGTGFTYEAMKSSSVAVQTSGLAEKAKWAANAGKSGSKTVNDFINGLEETTNGKGIARNFEAFGGYEQTLKDFEMLNPTNVKDIQTKYGLGKVGALEDGTKVVARQIRY